MVIKRQTAYKLWIKQINKGRYVKQEGFEPNYIELGEKKPSRVNIIASVVGKFISTDGNYGVLTLDDSTDTIRAKAFGPEVEILQRINIGDVITFIGKIKEYLEERYLSPEVAKPLKDKNWMTVRALEIGKFEESAEKVVEEKKVEEIKISSEKVVEEKIEVKEDSDENLSEKILEIIRKLDTGKGANLKEIIEKSGLDEDSAKNLIIGLLKSGDLFEPTKNMLKVLD